MAYSETLADRIRESVARQRGVDEIKMMGGLCFMIGGHMTLGIVGEELMVRVGPDGYERAVASHARSGDGLHPTLRHAVRCGYRHRHKLTGFTEDRIFELLDLPTSIRRTTPAS